ncbi:hypothetical protein KEM44_21225 [Sinorhizobium meliloti]|uniref:hypothetical protein n=1 Tax=Rhizobium meliloti TaxID=382 RepID=UPI000B5A23FF|nr:hypothetical protein [Sinorhizobium meliloti]ASJ59006.1 hypothetical protein SMB554_07245 [Sinorhizobium meliloti]MCK3783465.1 hypothetical protein [Sinorhizobium meliloti]MCK3787905.1 hypothetical protein [Sinorhizobium meliloti]MCK3794818.1 hypothetical protein [Sinorhizobium meliloti]UTG98648.1 hypothetical protein KEM44_21225 [Sinorhizobium meliloti]
MWRLLFSFLSGPLGRILDTIDRKVDSETERQRIKTQAVESYVAAQAQVLTGRGWWFPLFFLVPAGLWFSAVCIFSIFFCRACVWPQDWTIAALPPPLNEWMGAIVGSLFIGKAGEILLKGLRR